MQTDNAQTVVQEESIEWQTEVSEEMIADIGNHIDYMQSDEYKEQLEKIALLEEIKQKLAECNNLEILRILEHESEVPVYYTNGLYEKVSQALEYERIQLTDLDKYRIKYDINK